jgi:hypothetical protein
MKLNELLALAPGEEVEVELETNLYVGSYDKGWLSDGRKNFDFRINLPSSAWKAVEDDLVACLGSYIECMGSVLVRAKVSRNGEGEFALEVLQITVVEDAEE